MDLTIHPHKLRGEISIIPSKSIAHRYLICSAFADGPTTLVCPETNRDMDATADCLNALGAKILRTYTGYQITPIGDVPQKADLNCCESGSTLRFLLPIAGALGVDATFHMAGRLSQRPLSPLWEEMERMGCQLERPTDNTIRCQGKLHSGKYTIDGSISSQFITGLLFALSLIDGPTELEITGNIESKPYIAMTQNAMDRFHAPNYRAPGYMAIEGDWSNGAFFVTAAHLGSNLYIHGLEPTSIQGDRAVVDILKQMETCIANIDVTDIPDLVPILAVAASAGKGAVFTNIRRLRLKESDRVATVIHMINALGGKAEADENTLTIHGTGLQGGTVDSHNDHRIAMAAAIAATVCTKPVTILGANAVTKSYPKFWDEYQKLGGNYEQHIR